MSSVHCSIAPPAAVRLLESEFLRFPEFSVLSFLSPTADASVFPRHCSVHLGLGDLFFLRFTPLDPPCSVETCSPQVGCSYSLRTDGLYVQGIECLVLQFSLLHTWTGEDQCRVNPLQRYYLSHTN